MRKVENDELLVARFLKQNTGLQNKSLIEQAD
jgi:hypothetical protein